MNSEDRYAAYRPQALRRPFPALGWTMILRGLLTVALAFPALAGFATAVRTGHYDNAVTFLSLGGLFIVWGGRVVTAGTAIALRFSVKPSAPADLAQRVDPHTGESITYGAFRYAIENLRYLFLRKELPDQQKADIVDELISLLGHAAQPIHPMKRTLLVDVLRGAGASIGLLIAFIAAFMFIQVDATMQGQGQIVNLIFLLAFIWILRYWGLTREASLHRQQISIPTLLVQIGCIFLAAVMIPVLLGMLGPAAAIFTGIRVPSPFGILVLLVALGAVATGLVLVISSNQSRRAVYDGNASVAISDRPPLEFHGRVPPQDVINAFWRHIATTRTWSLDDRVYSFSETRGAGGIQQQSDHAELIAESAPLVRTDLLPSGAVKATLIVSSLFGEFLLAASAILLALTMSSAVGLVSGIFVTAKIGAYSRFLTVLLHPFFMTGLYLIVLSRFGSLFREIGMRFLAEVIFQSYMTVISISSSTHQGRGETNISQVDGTHLFDTGHTSTLRLRIQCAFIHSVTMIGAGLRGDSLGQARYIIGAEREDRLMNVLAEQGYRYIAHRTDMATTRVRSQTVEMQDARRMLTDPDSEAQIIQSRQQSALANENRSNLFLTQRRGPKTDNDA